MDYQLEVKQLVDYPRCRIYRDFIRTLMSDKNIRTSGCSYLFYYILLCSFANYRTSHRRIDGISYTLNAGEWILSIKELQECFRCHFQHQVLSILKELEEQHYLSYSLLGKNKLIKFSILEWQKDNTILDYSYPCKKDAGFFFFPIRKLHELISMGKCSEMDILLDLWIHAIYNDTQVLGSDVGPVVYFRNNSGVPLTNYSELSTRWGRSRATVCRILKKLEATDLISLVAFGGSHGSVIYLNSYLSTMFQVSDVLIDKEEVSLSLSLPIHIPDEESIPETDLDEQVTVSDSEDSVPNSHMKFIVTKVARLLETQGVPCCQCRKSQYQLSKLSDCIGNYILKIICPYGNMAYQFELRVDTQGELPDPFVHIPSIELTPENNILEGGVNHV
ncbi:MAG: helix-turn-helix domain-containing protein [Hespellia sp.]|nr:helix-turn-helix domain-containing protein [Hespellia sp.]